MIAYGAEDNLHPNSSLLVQDNAFSNTRPKRRHRGQQLHTAIPVSLVCNSFTGSPPPTPLAGPGTKQQYRLHRTPGLTGTPGAFDVAGDPPPDGTVPEPGTMALALTGGIGLLLARRRSGRA